MRPSFKATAAVLFFSAAVASAAEKPQPTSYDPEVALLVLTIQKQSVQLLREELLRQAEWLDLGTMKVMLGAHAGTFAKKVSAGLTADSDVLADYREQILKVNVTAAGEADKLLAEIRRYHDLRPGKPMVKLKWPAPGPPQKIFAVDGIGSDAIEALVGTPAIDEPVAYAERRFGSTGPFLRRRKWNLDFYLGAFTDLLPHYKHMGYRRIYRLRAPYASYGKEAYVLPPEPGLRPRLVYAGFYGQDLFLHTRAQWAILANRAKGEGPAVRTLTCPDCPYPLPGVTAMKSLIENIPYVADTVVVGYDYLFEPEWKNSELGVYENDYWRLTYYRTEPTTTATVVARRTNFGEILAASLTPLVRKGAQRVYYAGPAAQVEKSLSGNELLIPTQFVTLDGHTKQFDNAFSGHRRKSTSFAAMPSPLFATKEWLHAAPIRNILAFDIEMVRLAEQAALWATIPDRNIQCGIAGVLGGLSSLHPEEDRALYTLVDESVTSKESAKRRFRDTVLAKIKAAGKVEAK